MTRYSASSLSPARMAGLVGVLLLGSALPGAAQIRQAPPPVKRPEPGKIQPLPAGPLGDLVITAVIVQDVPIPTPSTQARVYIQNKGSAPVTFPAGSVLARGDAAQAGGIAFQPMTTPVDYEIAAGQGTVLTLTVGDPCAAGKAGTVTFRVDPDNKVRESDKGNNSSTVNGVGSFVTGDLQAVVVSLETTLSKWNLGGVPAGFPATLSVTFRNVGTGPVLWCPGVALWRETASPVSSKYGLRTVKNEGTGVGLFPAGATRISKLAGAYAAGDLPRGPYTWSVLVNPDGGMRETSSANNAATTTVTIN